MTGPRNSAAFFNDFIDPSCAVIEDAARVVTVDSNTCSLTLGNTGTAASLGFVNGLNLVSNANGLFVNGGLEIFGTGVTGGAPAAFIRGGLSLFGGGTAVGRPNKIIGLAAGALNATSTDGVNGSQLFNTGNSVTGIIGGGATLNTATGAVTLAPFSVGGQLYTNIVSAIQAAGGGWRLQADGGVATVVNPSGTVNFISGSNIAVSKDGHTLTIATSPTPRFASVTTTGGITVGGVIAANGGFRVGPGQNIDLGGNRVTNVAPGTAPTDAVNVSQLTTLAAAPMIFSGNDSTAGAINLPLGGTLTIRGAASTAGGYSGSNLKTVTDPNSGAILLQLADRPRFGNVVINAAGSGRITGLTAAALNETSTDAVIGSQLFATNRQVNINTTAIAQIVNNGGGVKYFHSNSMRADSRSIGTDSIAAGPDAAAHGNGSLAQGAGAVAGVEGAPATVVRDIAIGADSRAAGGSSVGIGDGARAVVARGVALGAGAAANNAGDIALGAGTITSAAVATPTITIQGRTFTLAGGAPASTVSIGAPGRERTLTNVAAGRISAGSTDGVNGSQLFATIRAIGSITQLSGGFVRYSNSSRTLITLGGADSFTPVRIDNLGEGRLAPGSTSAVNGSQLHKTNEKVARLDNVVVKYDVDANGGRANSVTLHGGDPNTPVVIRRVAAGVDDTDAINVAQLKQSNADISNFIDQRVNEIVNTAVATFTEQASTQILQAANAYTDQQFGQLQREINRSRSEARQAAAIGLAAASLKYDHRPGKISMAIGGGVWRGEGALAMGLGFTSEDGMFRGNVSTATSNGEWGVGAGLNFTLN